MKVIKFAVSIVLAVGMAFALFMLMAELISQDVTMDENKRTKIADIHMTETKIEEFIEEEPPEKPEIQQEVPDELPPPTMDNVDVDTGISTNVATGDIKVDVGIGSINLNEGEYLPIVKVAPTYPRRAASRGIQGYVIVEFTVTETGATEGCTVLEAMTSKGNPTTIFNSAACRAAGKFKYKPRVKDGVAEKVYNVPNKITFKLAD